MAQAILLKEVEGLGEAGEAIEVSPGYLRNFLIPRKLAQPATRGALEEAQRRREAAEKAAREALERAGETAALLSKTVLTITHRAGEDGRLFGSVTSKEIAQAIQEARGLKMVMSAPRSRSRRNWFFSSVSRISSSPIAG